MTLAEQREKLIELLDNAIEEQWMPDALLHAISAAGFSIVADEAFDAFELAKVDLARKP